MRKRLRDKIVLGVPKDAPDFIIFDTLNNSPEFVEELVSKKQETDYYRADGNLRILYEEGKIEPSLARIRAKYGPRKFLDIGKDTIIPPVDFDDAKEIDVNIYTHSRWYNSLPEPARMDLKRDIVDELHGLGLPLSLMENYTTALIYGGEISPTLNPNTFFYNIITMNMRDVEKLNLTTQDKKLLKDTFKQYWGIPLRGRLPKKFKPQWSVFKSKILDIGKNKSRRPQDVETALMALGPKEKLERDRPNQPGKRRKKGEETYEEQFSRLNPNPNIDFGQLGDFDKKGGQKLRKRKERRAKANPREMLK